jgi:hypothetical protein
VINRESTSATGGSIQEGANGIPAGNFQVWIIAVYARTLGLVSTTERPSVKPTCFLLNRISVVCNCEHTRQSS